MKKAPHGGVFYIVYPNTLLKYYKVPTYLFFTPNVEIPAPVLDIAAKFRIIDLSENKKCVKVDISREKWFNSIGDGKMENAERIAKMKASKYKEIFGIEKHVFDRILRLLEAADAYQRKSKAGRKSQLSVLDKLVIALQYWREYRTYRHIAFDYNVGKSTIGEAIIWVENTIIASGLCNLKSARELRENASKIKIAIVDVTEQEIERPKKGRKNGIPARKNVTQ